MIVISALCDNCGQVDDHPKLHYGAATFHHDCLPFYVVRDLTTLGYWDTERDERGVIIGNRWVEGEDIPSSHQHPEIAKALAVRAFALDGLRGSELRKRITSGKALVIKGGASGLDSARTAAILTQLNGGAADAITGPLKLLFLSAVRATATGTDTEWTTASGYTAGTGFSGLTFAAATPGAPSTQNSNVAATITNAPAQTWAGNKVVDSTATPKTTWWGTLTGSNKTVNAGDTCTVPSGSVQTSL